MRKKAILGLITVTLTGAMLAGSVHAAGVQAAIDFRQSVMTIYKWHLGPMGAMVKGKIPFDKAKFKANAEGLATVTRLNAAAGFPKGSKEDTEATDEIWQNWEAFEKGFQNLRDESQKLAQVAASGDQEAMINQFKATAKNCGGCHDDFREKK